MAGGRRVIGKGSSSSAHDRSNILGGGHSSVDEYAGHWATSPAYCPKHVPIPSIAHDSTLMFEFYMFGFTVLALALQYLHLYRTVWWLPNSYNNQTVNFYLIDPYLVGLLICLLSRRFVWSLVKTLVTSIASFLRREKTPGKEDSMLLTVAWYTTVTFLIGFSGYFTFFVFRQHALINFMYLCYPLTIYLILFWPSASAFFELFPSSSADVFLNSVEKSNNTDRANSQHQHHDMQSPSLHLCSVVPSTIREEVEVWITDFNNRLRQALFNSLLNAYYAGFVPCCFAVPHLHYDFYCVTQHIVFVWLTCFVLYITHYFPPSYCDTLHRSALHLGQWSRLERNPAHLPHHPWSEGMLWAQGAFVKHSRELFRAEGLSNAAVPGESENKMLTVYLQFN